MHNISDHTHLISTMPIFQYDCGLKSHWQGFYVAQLRRENISLWFIVCLSSLFSWFLKFQFKTSRCAPRRHQKWDDTLFSFSFHSHFDKENRLGMFFKQSLYPDYNEVSYDSSGGVSLPWQYKGLFQMGFANALCLWPVETWSTFFSCLKHALECAVLAVKGRGCNGILDFSFIAQSQCSWFGRRRRGFLEH